MGCALSQVLRGGARQAPQGDAVGRRPVLRPTPGGAGLLALLVLGSCDSPRPREPNVVLILIDTLRADHLGIYGYARDTSPNIDQLGEEGVVVRNVISQAPATIPSVPALFTSMYASKAIDAGRHRVPDKLTTLAEVMLDHGYETAAFSSNPLVVRRGPHAWGGLDQGFVLFDDSVANGEDEEGWSPQWRSPAGIVRKASAWLDGRPPGEKFFLYLHIMDPHDVYWPPRRWRSVYDDGYEGKEAIARGNPSPYEREILGGKQVDLAPRDIEHLRALYDAEIRYVDVHVGRLMRRLSAMQLLDDTVVVVTSDHGEEFFEHDGLKHGYTLYQEAVQVPWLMRYPRALPPGRVVDDAIVQLIDLAPTILDVVGASVPQEMEGASLLPRIRGEGQVPSRRYAVTETPYSGAKALVTEEWKYIDRFGETPWREDLAPRYSTRAELYNLEADPREQVNCIDEHGDVAVLLHELLARHVSSAGGDGSTLGAEARERLRSLGYLQ